MLLQILRKIPKTSILIFSLFSCHRENKISQKNKKLITYCKKKPQKIYKNKFYLNGACSLYVIIDY